METLNAKDLTDTIAQCEVKIREAESHRVAIQRNAAAELEEARASMIALRAKIKDALNAGADTEAEELMRTWAQAQDAYRDCSWGWAQRELSTRNSLAELTRQAREARDDLSLLEHCGGRPESYEEIYDLIEKVRAEGKSLRLNVDAGVITLNGAELAEYWSEMEPGEYLHVLGVVNA